VLGRRLDGRHLAIVAWRGGGGGGEQLLDDTRSALEAAGIERPFLVAEPTGSVAAWFTPPRSPDEWSAVSSALEAALSGVGVQVAYGDSLSGVAGFARSYQQAVMTKTVVVTSGSDAGLTEYSEVGLASLLLRDTTAARRFAAEELGELAEPQAVRERATLAAFYACAHDQSRTARALGVHRNTIARRLARAEEALGSDLAERVPERAAALTIVRTLPGGG
jgi:DNA-binding PucR family transcriptional regulator